MGRFANPLPMTRARQNPRQSRLYETLLRSPTIAPEGLGQTPTGTPDLTKRFQRRFNEPGSGYNVDPRYAKPGGYTAPGGGIRVETNGTTITIEQEEPFVDRAKRWLQEDSIWSGVKNQWLVLAGVGALLWRRKG